MGASIQAGALGSRWACTDPSSVSGVEHAMPLSSQLLGRPQHRNGMLKSSPLPAPRKKVAGASRRGLGRGPRKLGPVIFSI